MAKSGRGAGRHRIIGRRLFTDGIERDVYEDADDRQWVTGYDGERVDGLWLPPADFAAWLDPQPPPAELHALLRPYPAEEMTSVPVSSYVCNPRNEGLRCLAS